MQDKIEPTASEQAAWHAGLDEGRAQKSCLAQIQEPEVNQQLTTEQEPVTWLLRRSAFRASPDGQDAEGHEWLEEADEPGQESSFPVYAAPVLAAQPIAWPKDARDVRDFFRSDFITAQFAAEDQEPCDEDRYLISAHDFVSAVNWWADFPHIPRTHQAAPAAVAAPDERAAFEAWLGIKPCGAAHDFGWAAWQARAALSATQRGLEQFIEQLGDVHFQRCRVGSKEGEIRWDIEFGHYGAEVRGKTLREAITKALAAQAKQGEHP